MGRRQDFISPAQEMLLYINLFRFTFDFFFFPIGPRLRWGMCLVYKGVQKSPASPQFCKDSENPLYFSKPVKKNSASLLGNFSLNEFGLD